MNCLYRYKKYLSSSAKKLALNSYIYSNFSYCPIAWHLSSAKSKNKIEKIQQRALQLLHNNSEQTSIFEPGLSTMEVKQLRTLAVEVYKTINNINPSYMKEIFLTSDNISSERLNTILHLKDLIK